MRILHIIGTLDPRAGGPIESVRTLMSYGPLGYTGEVVTLDDPSAPFLQNLPFPVTALGPTATSYGYTRKLDKWLVANRNRFDGVIVNGLWRYCGVAAWRNLRGHIPYMVFTHGMLDPYFKRAFPLKHIKKVFYWYLFEYWVLRSAFRVLFTTLQEEQLAEQSFAFFRWKPYVVPYGSSGPPVAREACLAAFHESFPAIGNRRFLLYLGRIHPKKGCDLLIEAFAKNAHLDPDLDLVMAGPDQTEWKARLANAAQMAGIGDRVHWPGMLMGNAKWGAFYACESFILPSHQENFGIAVAEALACSRPVLVSDQVNIAPEIAADGSGYMENDTLDGTIKLIRRWMETPEEEREVMRKRAHQLFRTRYDMKANARMILALFGLAENDKKKQSSVNG